VVHRRKILIAFDNILDLNGLHIPSGLPQAGEGIPIAFRSAVNPTRNKRGSIRKFENCSSIKISKTGLKYVVTQHGVLYALAL
jgi:hypothetical protein